jgi:hypothetical protein
VWIHQRDLRSQRFLPGTQGFRDTLTSRETLNWRRERDSNPRWAFDPYTLSRGAPSTTRPSLRRSIHPPGSQKVGELRASRGGYAVRGGTAPSGATMPRPRRPARILAGQRQVKLREFGTRFGVGTGARSGLLRHSAVAVVQDPAPLTGRLGPPPAACSSRLMRS